jgi:hypothetical protein
MPNEHPNALSEFEKRALSLLESIDDNLRSIRSDMEDVSLIARRAKSAQDAQDAMLSMATRYSRP